MKFGFSSHHVAAVASLLLASLLLTTSAGVKAAPNSMAAGSDSAANRNIPGVSFAPHIDYPVGNEPMSVAVADFNHDGVLDLAMSNSSSPIVSVLLGTGNGSFGQATDFAATDPGAEIAVGDFNRDGIPDLVAADVSPMVSVLLGNGDGSFAPVHTFSTIHDAATVAVGDFNRDGIPDLVTADLSGPGGSISVLLGLGNGSFGSPTLFSVCDDPFSALVADFNRDGISDLAMLCSGGGSVLLGRGDGSFGPAINFLERSDPASLVVGDFNRDGIPDLLTANYENNGTTPKGSISVLLGLGNGHFQPMVNYPLNTRAYAAAVGDFNRDGIPDVVVTHIENNNVSVLLGLGDGSFSQPQSFLVDHRPNSVVVGDFNHDGRLDIVATSGLDNTASVLLNTTLPSSTRSSVTLGIPVK